LLLSPQVPSHKDLLEEHPVHTKDGNYFLYR
jgi:hypothetical protein